jgi:anti-sigma factor RsiW
MKQHLTHEAANELLPWYANGTLSTTERGAVEEHLNDCTSCTRELESLQQVGAAMLAFGEDLPPARASSLANVLAAIDEHERTKPEQRSALGRLFDGIWTPSVSTARFALAAQLVVIVALGLVYMQSQRREPSFTTLSGGSPTASGSRLTVVFEPDATEAMIRKALTDVQGNVVSGPSALGVYVVAIPASAKHEGSVQTAITRLRGMTGVVRFVEVEP